MNDSEFDEYLKSAKENAPLPQSFAQAVWRRIEMTESEPRSISPVLWKKRVTALGVAATVAAGLWLGDIATPENKVSQVNHYAASISPFLHAYAQGK